MDNEERFRRLLDSNEYDFRYDCGISEPSFRLKLSDRKRIIDAAATHYCILRVKAELDQLVEGLNCSKLGY